MINDCEHLKTTDVDMELTGLIMGSWEAVCGLNVEHFISQTSFWISGSLASESNKLFTELKI